MGTHSPGSGWRLWGERGQSEWSEGTQLGHSPWALAKIQFRKMWEINAKARRQGLPEISMLLVHFPPSFSLVVL